MFAIPNVSFLFLERSREGSRGGFAQERLKLLNHLMERQKGLMDIPRNFQTVVHAFEDSHLSMSGLLELPEDVGPVKRIRCPDDE